MDKNMMSVPFFRDNILSNIYHNFKFYLEYDNFFAAVLAVAVASLAMVFIVGRFCKSKEYSLLSNEAYYFSVSKNTDKLALALLLFSFVLYTINIFSLNGTIFGAYDTMNIDNIRSMQRGVKPVFDSVRFSPLHNIDYNLVYALTHNFRVIDYWVIIKQFLCLFLMYKFFDFVPVGRRLCMLAVINFLPAVFWVNNAIFGEQNTLIFMLLSFLCLKCRDNKLKTVNLLGFALFMNAAIYTKESNTLIYGGILAFLVLRRVFAEEITLRSFLHPFKTLSEMPLEFILFGTLLIYSIAYLLQSNLLTDGAYLRHNYHALSVLLKIYGFELIIAAVAVIMLAINLAKSGDYLLKGIIIGSIMMVFVLVFYLQISGYPEYYKTWYLYLPAIFFTAYVFINIPRKFLLPLTAVALFCSLVLNCRLYNREEGQSRYELAEFIITQSDKPIVLCVDSKNVKDSWKAESFNSALKYVYPEGKILFRTNHKFRPVLAEENDEFFRFENGECQAGDLVIINKLDNNSAKEENIRYENRIYQVYQM